MYGRLSKVRDIILDICFKGRFRRGTDLFGSVTSLWTAMSVCLSPSPPLMDSLHNSISYHNKPILDPEWTSNIFWLFRVLKYHLIKSIKYFSFFLIDLWCLIKQYNNIIFFLPFLSHMCMIDCIFLLFILIFSTQINVTSLGLVKLLVLSAIDLDF